MEERLILGDCMKALKDLPDKSVDLVLTDPPYLIKGMSCNSGMFKWKNRNFVAKKNIYREIRDNGIGDGIDSENFLKEILRVMKHVNVYLWCNKEQVKGYLDFFLGDGVSRERERE